MNVLVDNRNTNLLREKGFFSVQGNNIDWVTWGPAHIMTIIIPIVLSLIIFIFKGKIHKYFKNKTLFFKLVGWITLIFTILNRILLITQDYPFKWELFPYHLCRLSVFAYAILLIIGKFKYIKYIAFWSLAGAIFGLLLVDLGPIQDQVTKKWFNRSVGIDNYFWWDYFLAHIFGFVAPIFLWTAFSWKMKYKELMISTIGIFLFALIAFIIDWIFNDYSVNYFFLGKSSAFKLPLPDSLAFLSSWEWRMFTYTILGFILMHTFWFTWILQKKIKIL